MEELFELIVVIIVAGIGIISKAAKGKKKKKPASSGSAWDELGAKIETGFDKVIEILEEEDEDRPKIQIPPVPQQPAAVTAIPVQPSIMPVIAAESGSLPDDGLTEGSRSGEGDCEHPLHMPAPAVPAAPAMPVKRPVKPVEQAPAMQLERVAVHRSGVFSGRLTAAQLRHAVVMNEVLGRPAALRNSARR